MINVYCYFCARNPSPSIFPFSSDCCKLLYNIKLMNVHSRTVQWLCAFLNDVGGFYDYCVALFNFVIDQSPNAIEYRIDLFQDIQVVYRVNKRSSCLHDELSFCKYIYTIMGDTWHELVVKWTLGPKREICKYLLNMNFNPCFCRNDAILVFVYRPTFSITYLLSMNGVTENFKIIFAL